MKEEPEGGEEGLLGLEEKVVDGGALEFVDDVSGAGELMSRGSGDDALALGIFYSKESSPGESIFGWVAEVRW